MAFLWLKWKAVIHTFKNMMIFLLGVGQAHLSISNSAVLCPIYRHMYMGSMLLVGGHGLNIKKLLRQMVAGVKLRFQTSSIII